MPPAPTYLHVVLFNFKTGVPTATRDRVIESVRGQGLAPQVSSMIVARNRAPDPVYEWVAMLDFPDEAASEAFQKSAAHHAQIAADFAPYRDRLLVLDLVQPFETTIADNRGCAYRRTGMFKLKPDLPAEEQHRIMAGLAALGVGEPGVGQVIWGRNHFPKGEFAPFDWMILRDFADRDAYAAFDASPARKAFLREIFSPAVADSLVLEIAI
jgi:hypothetical protein